MLTLFERVFLWAVALQGGVFTGTMGWTLWYAWTHPTPYGQAHPWVIRAFLTFLALLTAVVAFGTQQIVAFLLSDLSALDPSSGGPDESS